MEVATTAKWKCILNFGFYSYPRSLSCYAIFSCFSSFDQVLDRSLPRFGNVVMILQRFFNFRTIFNDFDGGDTLLVTFLSRSLSCCGNFSIRFPSTFGGHFHPQTSRTVVIFITFLIVVYRVLTLSAYDFHRLFADVSIRKLDFHRLLAVRYHRKVLGSWPSLITFLSRFLSVSYTHLTLPTKA